MSGVYSKMRPMPRRLLTIHGHFYQPPREDPWTGKVERQPSAGEDHDWNARVARECYAPNAAARILDDRGKAVELVNNYRFMSFNFGPTLLSWLELADAKTYAAILEADAASARRLDGHGNALAQAYNHMIMPLANARDQRTQILWGLADFEHRFKRDAEAMWLPETAADDAVLERLAEHGMRYAILAPGQAQRVRPLEGGDWQDVGDGSVDVSRSYLWRSRSGRELALFFYDGGLSREAAFGELLADSARFSETLAARVKGEGGYVSLCTDGETYGHHKKFAEMGLARAFKIELPRRDVHPVNYAYALAERPPRWRAEIKSGPQRLGTAWSCAHGVGRWMEDCGCGTEGSHGRWRGPLRDALDWLRDELIVLTEAHGNELFSDVWSARDSYVDVLLQPGDAAAERQFLRRHMRRRWPTAASRRKALGMMELQKFAMFMYTSCGWFFSDVSGLEASQNLKYAARAVELAKQAFGEDLEPELLSRLGAAKGASKALADGAAVYRAGLAGRACSSSRK
jgi:alpha-amylase/alpha-mannosidase (GH57 family)